MCRNNRAVSLFGRYSTHIPLFFLFFFITNTEAKEIIGIYEKVKINHVGLIFDSKIDTGAKNSSLNIKDIHLANREGKIWVIFTIKDRAGKSVTLDKPLHRFVHIKRKKAPRQVLFYY